MDQTSAVKISAERTGRKQRVSFKPSPGFASWLAQIGGSLAFTTYQANRLIVVGTDPASGTLRYLERNFRRPMGIAVAPGGLSMAGLFQIWTFRNFLGSAQTQVLDGAEHDAVFVPVTTHTTGELDVHDVHLWHGQPVFVATRFNCLACLSRSGSFEPWWRPPFIDSLVGEDRCHLNGLAMREDKPAFVTCIAHSNTSGQWRDKRADGGLMIHVPSDEIVASGLSMPHSPRWHDQRVYLVQSGKGEFGRVDPSSGLFETICFLPGFARGLAIVGEYAVIGVSSPREGRGFNGLPLEEILQKQDVSAVCQLAVVRLSTGKIEHSLQILQPVSELYDVVHIPNFRAPMVVDFQQDAIRSYIQPSGTGSDQASQT